MHEQKPPKLIKPLVESQQAKDAQPEQTHKADKEPIKVITKDEELSTFQPSSGGGGMMYIPKIADKKNGN